MSQGEAQAMSVAKDEGVRTSWEQIRLSSFYNVIAQVGTKEIKEPKDLFELPWDNEKKDKPKHAPNFKTREEFLRDAKLINI